MSDDKGHGYTWSDVRKRPAEDLAVGDTWVNPGAFTVYRTDKDGNVYPGLSPLDGYAWTITARDGDAITARRHDRSRAETAKIPEGQCVLAVTGPEPVGTVLAVNSHRAADRLKRALGREPAAYYDKAMRRGGKFVVLYGDEVATALGIRSITRTRLKPEDVALCLSSRATVIDAGLRVTYDDSEHARRDADRAAGRKVPEAAS